MTKDLEKIFSKFKSGVYVLTTLVDDVKYGWTISWVSKVSVKPSIVMISVGKNRKNHEILMDSEVFALNVIGSEEIELARHFGLSNGENLKNFNGIDFISLNTGSPILKQTVGALDCKIIKTVDMGDHVVFFGEVLDFILKDGDGIVFSKEIFP
jgi:flavin reductase (DIM6/NTAB) family NADH-FMN oxidoreductase RutF